MFRGIVKLLGMVLGGLLALAILMGIAYGAVELLHAAGVIKGDPVETRVYEVSKEGLVEVGKKDEGTKSEAKDDAETKTEVKNLEIRLGAGSLELKEGEKLKVSTDITEMEVEEKDGTLKITENSRWHLFSWQRGMKVTVEVPKDYQFEEVKLETGPGKVSIGNILANKIKMEAGAGKIEIEQILATNELKMNLGAGEVSIRQADGELIDINCGVGKVGIGLADAEEAYKFKLDKGVGKITVGGREASGTWSGAKATKEVKIEGGVGAIEIKTGVVQKAVRE